MSVDDMSGRFFDGEVDRSESRLFIQNTKYPCIYNLSDGKWRFTPVWSIDPDCRLPYLLDERPNERTK